MGNCQQLSVAWLPDSFGRLFHAFDIAFPRLLPIAAEHGIAADAARRQLADMLLRFKEDDRSAEEIAEAALREIGIRTDAGRAM